MTDNNRDLKAMQIYLKKEIIEMNYDSDAFTLWMDTQKQEGCNIENWTMNELKSMVSEFKKENTPVEFGILYLTQEINADETLDLGSQQEDKQGESSDEVVDNFFWTGLETANEPPVKFYSFIKGYFCFFNKELLKRKKIFLLTEMFISLLLSLINGKLRDDFRTLNGYLNDFGENFPN